MFSLFFPRIFLKLFHYFLRGYDFFLLILGSPIGLAARAFRKMVFNLVLRFFMEIQGFYGFTLHLPCFQMCQ